MLNRILIYNSGGGIGDALQIIPLINALKLEFELTEKLRVRTDFAGNDAIDRIEKTRDLLEAIL